jgi:hypothetical protein
MTASCCLAECAVDELLGSLPGLDVRTQKTGRAEGALGLTTWSEKVKVRVISDLADFGIIRWASISTRWEWCLNE